jgi:hypothetical protein
MKMSKPFRDRSALPSDGPEYFSRLTDTFPTRQRGLLARFYT